MDKFILHIKVHGYNEFNEMRACFTAEVSGLEEAFVSEAETVRAVKDSHVLCEELYVRSTLMNNNKIVYNHNYQLI